MGKGTGGRLSVYCQNSRVTIIGSGWPAPSATAPRTLPRLADGGPRGRMSDPGGRRRAERRGGRLAPARAPLARLLCDDGPRGERVRVAPPIASRPAALAFLALAHSRTGGSRRPPFRSRTHHIRVRVLRRVGAGRTLTPRPTLALVSVRKWRSPSARHVSALYYAAAGPRASWRALPRPLGAPWAADGQGSNREHVLPIAAA